MVKQRKPRKTKDVEKEHENFKQWVMQELEHRGYTRSHDFSDFFKACKEVIEPSVSRLNKRSPVIRAMATEIILEFIDPWR